MRWRVVGVLAAAAEPVVAPELELEQPATSSPTAATATVATLMRGAFFEDTGSQLLDEVEPVKGMHLRG
jgi:hypothetical protein